MDFFFYRSHNKIRWFKYTALPSSLPGSDLTSSGKSRREGRVFLMFILFYQGSFYIVGKVVNTLLYSNMTVHSQVNILTIVFAASRPFFSHVNETC